MKELNKNRILYWLLSVSYTHLDVYKRQPEAKDFDFSTFDSYMIGNVKFIWTEFQCPACGKQISIDEMKKIEKEQKRSHREE